MFRDLPAFVRVLVSEAAIGKRRLEEMQVSSVTMPSCVSSSNPDSPA